MKYPPRAVTVTRLAELAQQSCPRPANGAAQAPCDCGKIVMDPAADALSRASIAARGCTAARATALLLAKLSDGEYAALVRRAGGVLA